MRKRWLIRGLALTVLTLCVVAWVGSYWSSIALYNKDFEITLSRGRVLCALDGPSATTDLEMRVKDSYDWSEWDRRVDVWFFGFTADYRAEVIQWTIPLWFPTLLAALVLWLVWRKTRAKPVGGAFPVEVAVQGEGTP